MLLVARVGPWSAEWTGGPYADLRHLEHPAPLSVPNLWDYRSSSPRIPVTVEALRVELVQWVDAEGSAWSAELPYL